MVEPVVFVAPVVYMLVSDCHEGLLDHFPLTRVKTSPSAMLLTRTLYMPFPRLYGLMSGEILPVSTFARHRSKVQELFAYSACL